MKQQASFHCVKKCLLYMTGKRYATGGKYCGTCRVFVLWGKTSCPCCRTRLRNRPRSKSGWEAQQKRNKVRFID